MCSIDGGSEIAGALAEADLAGLLDIAERALRRANALPLAGAVTDVELTQAVQRLQAVVRIAEARKLAVVAEIDQRHAARGQSAASTEDLLTRTLQLTPGEARTHTELAAGLALVPDTAKALADGRMGVGQAAVAVKKATEVADRKDAAELLAAIDQTAATVGQTTNRVRLAREIDTAVAKTGVDVLAERERRAFTRRKVEWSVREGMDVLTAHLDPVGAATVRGMLDALSDKTGERDTRSFVQRQADALTQMAALAAAADGAPQPTLQSARVLLITTPDALHAVAGADPAILDGHGPISPQLARQLCCDARVTPVVTDRNGAILDVGRDERLPTPAQRAAVIARDKHCVGCGAPVSRCQIHHIQWWDRDKGPTDLDNLVLVCWNCHTHIHQHGWHITQQPDGRYTAAPPDPAPPESPHLDAMKERDLRSPLTARVSDTRGCQSVDHREEEGPDDVTVCRNRSAPSPVGDRAPGRQRRGARAGADRQ